MLRQISPIVFFRFLKGYYKLKFLFHELLQLFVLCRRDCKHGYRFLNNNFRLFTSCSSFKSLPTLSFISYFNFYLV